MLESYAAGSWFRGERRGRAAARRLDRRGGRPHLQPRARPRRDGDARAHRRRPGDPRADLPRAGRAAQGAGQAPVRATRTTLYELSLRTGATQQRLDGRHRRRLRHACSASPARATRELPNDTIVLDGALEQLGRGGQFVGQHVYTSRPGVAVQINAFNFPVWGMLEKLAPGVPRRAADASSSRPRRPPTSPRPSYAGSSSPASCPRAPCSCCAAAPARLLDELGVQDSVAFTGSAHTAGILRTHTSCCTAALTLGVEADSLNCSILGPDVTADDPEFDLFVKGVVTEMTVKAGPEVHRDPARDRAGGASPTTSSKRSRDRLAKVTVGNPADEGVRMGALASPRPARRGAQGRRGAAQLRRGRVRRPGPRRLVDADAERGAFMAPVLLRARARCGRAARRRAVRSGQHGDHLRLGRRGRRARRPRPRVSLVGSLVTNDPAVARTSTLGLAPWHGRILVLNRDDAAESTGHGSPAADARARRSRPRRRRRGARRHPRRPPPHAAHRDPGLARHDDRDHRPLDDRLDAQRSTAPTRSARASPS